MAENRVSIDGGMDATGAIVRPLPVSGTIAVTSPITVLDAKIPNLRGGYILSLTDLPGVVAANTFVAIFNAPGSGRVITTLGAFISTYVASGGSTTRNSMQIMGITTATGGSSAASSIYKLDSAFPTATATALISNPTVTLGNGVANSPPPIGTTVGQYVHSVGLGLLPIGGGLVLREGEGLAFRTAAGNVNQTWNISVGWVEV